jgi:methylmalonyl-CoA/ethylmalonyl-CoA epimerase
MIIDHVGIVVPKIEEAGKIYPQVLEFTPATGVILDAIQKVYVQFFHNEEGQRIELIEPLDEESPAFNALKKGGGANHIGYRCSNVEDALANARTQNCIIVCQPVPGAGHEGRRVAFVVHPFLGLAEFVEYKNGG